jgi:hypothetical protein
VSHALIESRSTNMTKRKVCQCLSCSFCLHNWPVIVCRMSKNTFWKMSCGFWCICFGIWLLLNFSGLCLEIMSVKFQIWIIFVKFWNFLNLFWPLFFEFILTVKIQINFDRYLILTSTEQQTKVNKHVTDVKFSLVCL